MDRTILNKLLLILLIGLAYGQNPFEELVSPTNTSGVFQGQATIEGAPAEEGDWVAAFDEDGNVAIEVVRGFVDKNGSKAVYQVDGLSGATITSRGVSATLKYWLSEDGFGPYLTRLKVEGVSHG